MASGDGHARIVLGFIQGRLGPNRVGPGGFLQPLADLIKFIFKEDIVPDKSTRFVYFLAPILATVSPFVIEGTARTNKTTPATGARASKIVFPT